jgi:exodeoxyribonuclease VII small subunit
MATNKTNQENMKNSLETVNYEQAVIELEKLVTEMESGKLSLEETLSAYKRVRVDKTLSSPFFPRLNNKLRWSEDN